MQLCFATNNAHKLEEVAHAVGEKFTIISLDQLGHREELSETQTTLEGNSFQKADFIYRKFNVPCFADDTGLEVDALNGAPGVYSARYAGEQRNNDDNINLLLQNLAGIKNRKARFRTVITLIGLQGTHIFEGIVEGEITTVRKGDRGFGYDPVFRPLGFSKTFAEMNLEEKNTISHRAIAVEKLVTFLKNFSPAGSR